MRESVKKRLDKIEKELARMIAVDLEIVDRDTNKTIATSRGKGARHNVYKLIIRT